VVSLSLGYYHEEPEDYRTDGPLQERIDQLRSLGVTVVAAAGNDSTSRPFLPAALTRYRNGVLQPPAPAQTVADIAGLTADQWPPLISVGALNPDNSVALFSNGGNWVACYSPGAVLVSTSPLVDAGAQPSVIVEGSAALERTPANWRSNIDPDHFTGFGTWSGTSFAAPVLAGAIAQCLLEADLADVSAAAMAERAAAALTDLKFSLGPD
jgi:subtilisin family serine protease